MVFIWFKSINMHRCWWALNCTKNCSPNSSCQTIVTNLFKCNFIVPSCFWHLCKFFRWKNWWRTRFYLHTQLLLQLQSHWALLSLTLLILSMSLYRCKVWYQPLSAFVCSYVCAYACWCWFWNCLLAYDYLFLILMLICCGGENNR